MSPIKKVLFYIIGGGLIVLSLVIIFKDKGLLDLKEQRVKLAKIRLDNEILHRKNMALYKELLRLKNDNTYIEYVARRELKMVRDDEIVIQYHTGKKK